MPETSSEITAEECEALERELGSELSRVLGELTPGLAGIREQLQAAVAELRRGVPPPALALALENLHSFFALLAQLNESLEERRLPELDRFDAEVQRALDALDRAVAAGPDLTGLADRLEAQMLPALASWAPVAEELAGALRSRTPAAGPTA